ncbi:MAG TPA: hypothetical protein VFL54_03075 [Gammaproteobacteria bacterium]|nr:hypothetical protein [Gammaproteobacteria bacterium]
MNAPGLIIERSDLDAIGKFVSAENHRRRLMDVGPEGKREDDYRRWYESLKHAEAVAELYARALLPVAQQITDLAERHPNNDGLFVLPARRELAAIKGGKTT